MDDYLSSSGSPSEYQKLIGQIERFRDVGKTMTRMLEDYPDDALDMLQLLFASITAGATHGNIRSIGRIFREDRAKYMRLKETESSTSNSNPRRIQSWSRQTWPRLRPTLAVTVMKRKSLTGCVGLPNRARQIRSLGRDRRI